MNFIDMIKILRKNCDAKGVLGNQILMVSELSGTVYDPLHFPSLTANQILSNDWEIIYSKKEKLHTFEEAIAALKRGKTIKRINWTEKVIERDIYDDYSIAFTIDDFEANDWIIVRE